MELPAVALGGLAAVAAAAGGAVAWLFKQPASILVEQRATIDRERVERRAAQAESEHLRLELAECKVQRAHLRERENRLIAAASLLGNPADLGELLDLVPCGLVFTSAENRGSWLWANRHFLGMLGLTLPELRATSWRQIMHPADLARADRVEAAAHDSPVEDQVFRYRRHERVGGGYVRARWNCRAYHPPPVAGKAAALQTFCVVEDLGAVEG